MDKANPFLPASTARLFEKYPKSLIDPQSLNATMASLDDTKRLIEEFGCFYQKDSELGQRVDIILEEVGYYFKNTAGLIFAKVNTLENEVRDPSNALVDTNN